MQELKTPHKIHCGQKGHQNTAMLAEDKDVVYSRNKNSYMNC